MNAPVPAFQASLPGLCQVSEAVDRLSRGGAEERGAIFTKTEVVDFILDLIGYTVDAPLCQYRLLEPSAGDGDFLFRAIERLLQAAERTREPIAKLGECVRVVELHHDTCIGTRHGVVAMLQRKGAAFDLAERLAAQWVVQGDFLLQKFDQRFTHVVGNPPYVRQELIPDALIAEYRRRFVTLYDRADLYVPFVEHSLSLLEERGTLGFICADRWMKNKYGGPLRQLVSKHWLRFHVDMQDTPAFHSDVMAYPAITVIQKGQKGPTRVVSRPAIEHDALREISAAMLANENLDPRVIEVSGVTAGSDPWVLENFPQLALVRRLEASMPALEEAGCKVGIGVATGADGAFIGQYDEMEVESSRKLRLVMRSDIKDGRVSWQGRGVINPFSSSGRLASFEDHPKFAAFLLERRAEIDRRHIAQRNPHAWYRTIDRIYPEIAEKPKLLIPDIAGKAQIVYENEGLYPHHNLYFLTSQTWDLHALRGVLISGIAALFVGTYSTKMRGGYLRFQAQYLRRIRLPHWNDVSPALRERLAVAARNDDVSGCKAAVAELYGLSSAEVDLLA